MGVLDEIRQNVKKSLTKDEVSFILSNLLENTIKQRAKEIYELFIEEVKEKAKTSDFIGNPKMLSGEIKLLDGPLEAKKITKEEAEACYYYENHKEEFSDCGLLKDLCGIYSHYLDWEIGVYLSIKYVSVLHEIRKRLFSQDSYYEITYTDSCILLYNEFLKFVEEDKKCFELFSKMYGVDYDGDGYLIGTIKIPSTSIVRKNTKNEYIGKSIEPHIRYRIVC